MTIDVKQLDVQASIKNQNNSTSRCSQQSDTQQSMNMSDNDLTEQRLLALLQELADMKRW